MRDELASYSDVKKYANLTLCLSLCFNIGLFHSLLHLRITSKRTKHVFLLWNHKWYRITGKVASRPAGTCRACVQVEPTEQEILSTIFFY